MKRSGSLIDACADKKARIGRTDGFPVFAKGTVEIKLSEDPKYRYQFHKAVLERSSVWFVESIGQPFVESGPVPNTGRICYRYVLHALNDTDEPLLTRVSLAAPDTFESIKTEEKYVIFDLDSEVPLGDTVGDEADAAVSSRAHIESGKVKREQSESSVVVIESVETSSETVVKRSVTELEKEAVMRARKAQQCRLEAYNNLFLTFYSIPPQVAASDISLALQQCEALVKLAELYECLSIGHR
ncbi:hypothetical protein GP486_005457 [Trichoglossum hirsutum]|uniref:Uncharacterized protein n=1 Tax=Trichoglossum hirsutum TaxID=265104 RepID=A0A9P8RML4_9PEZI|nr:hypothetical protein GP486_005457 [Trichoglossum hirsutum]